MKKIVLLIMLSLAVTGCGGGTSQAPAPQQQESQGDDKSQSDNNEASDEAESTDKEGDDLPGEAPVSEVYLKIQSLVKLISPVEMPDNFLENTYGIDLNMLEDHLLVMSEEATSAETIAILKVKDEKDVQTAADALSVIVKEKSMEMENYLPDQYELVSKSKVNTKGRYVYLVISENMSDITGIIEENIS